MELFQALCVTLLCSPRPKHGLTSGYKKSICTITINIRRYTTAGNSRRLAGNTSNIVSSHASLTIYCVYLLVLLLLLQRLLLRGRFLLVLDLLLLEVLLLVRGPGDRGGVVDVDPLLALGRLVQVGVLVLQDVGMLGLVIILGLLR